MSFVRLCGLLLAGLLGVAGSTAVFCSFVFVVSSFAVGVASISCRAWVVSVCGGASRASGCSGPTFAVFASVMVERYNLFISSPLVFSSAAALTMMTSSSAVFSSRASAIGPITGIGNVADAYSTFSFTKDLQ